MAENQIEICGASQQQVDDFCRAYRFFQTNTLPSKIDREARANDLLARYRGNYSQEVINQIFYLVDGDPTGRWFGQLLSAPNREAIFQSQIEDINGFIDRLLSERSLHCLREWRDAGNKGIRTGVATLFLYLHSPGQYNVWLRKTHNGLSKVTDYSPPDISREMRGSEYEEYYRVFNSLAVEFRDRHDFVPQSMDWVLWAVGEIMDNPNNPGLRYYLQD